MPSAGDTSTYGIEPAPREQVSVLAVLRRRALIVVATALLCGGAAAVFAYANRDSYESRAELLFRQTIGPNGTALDLQPPYVDADNLAQDNVQLVDSRRVAAATARELRRLGADVSAEDVDDDVEVTGTKDSEVVDVAAQAASAERAALLANIYSRSAVRQIRQDEREQALATLRSVRRQLAEVGREQTTLPPALRNPAAEDRLTTYAERLQTIADAGVGSPRIIQPGYAPTAASGSPVQTILLGSLFGLLLGAGLALLREQADRRLHRTEEVSAAFDAPVLTTVPRNRALKRHRRFADLPLDVAEAFRMLLMNLRYAENEPVRSVLVTSARSREGKTTVAWNLASAASSSGLAVALVEADMRRPSIADRYDLEAAPGLAEALTGGVSIAEALQTVPLSADAKSNGYSRSIDVLVAGQPPPDPWALMQSPAMARLMQELKQHHDLVVLDTPPIPHVADAISLLRRVDGVVVTASVNSTRGPEARQLREQLQTLDARILGVVANGGSAATGYAYAPAAPPTAGAHDGANGAQHGADGRPGTQTGSRTTS
jgi:capsular exopolysaccharide synthesis family protein